MLSFLASLYRIWDFLYKGIENRAIKVILIKIFHKLFELMLCSVKINDYCRFNLFKLLKFGRVMGTLSLVYATKERSIADFR